MWRMLVLFLLIFCFRFSTNIHWWPTDIQRFNFILLFDGWWSFTQIKSNKKKFLFQLNKKRCACGWRKKICNIVCVFSDVSQNKTKNFSIAIFVSLIFSIIYNEMILKYFFLFNLNIQHFVVSFYSIHSSKST